MSPQKLIQVEDYEKFVGAETIERIMKKAKETRTDLPEVTAFCWHGHLQGVEPG